MNNVLDKIRRFYLRNLPKLVFGNDVCMHICLYVCRHRKRAMHISEGLFVYPFFNAYFIQNMLSSAMYSIARGYNPYIALGGRGQGYTNWDTFFRQPFDTTAEQVTIVCDRTTGHYNFSFTMAWHPHELRRWTRAYQTLVHLNEQTQRYVDADYSAIISPEDHVLGVLCRGTDYITIRPKGHPRQPSVEQVIAEVQEQMRTGQYNKIYLATEDQRITLQFEETFPNEIITNRRQYFDEAFETMYSQNNTLDITDVNLHRDDANYWRGIQYLSSMVILSRCQALVAGNCGGTILALMMNDNQYRYTHVFNLGMYD